MRIIFLIGFFCSIFVINSCYANKSRKIFNINNGTDDDLKLVLIDPTEGSMSCEISSFKKNAEVNIGNLKKFKILLVKFPNEIVLAYYIGALIVISDPNYINEFSIVSLVLLEDKKIHVISKYSDQNIKIQPDEGEGIDFPLMSGTENTMINNDINERLNINLDNPDVDYKNYHMNEYDAKILKACFSIFQDTE